MLIALFSICACTPHVNIQSGGIADEKWCEKDEDMPWTGCWQEIKQIDCESGELFEADEKIGEFRLKPDGRYSITWHPFETYTDYKGTYKINSTQGTISFNHHDSTRFDGDGFYIIRENGDLELTDIWFGSFSPDSEIDPGRKNCGYVFQ